MDPRYEHFKNFSGNDMSREEKRAIWLEISDMTGEEFDAMQTHHKEHQAGAPKVGDMAPDFTAEVLGAGRKRTGEFVTLSTLRGRPVALAFGSYT
ncbi:MAG: hypothetical protein E2O90_07825 [Alphaproteobacteria bacterium]|nr:hypothetical protein [Pseudomonadota bacterium]TDI65249.1 MAG: hypothetical protein E2O90_07825 [Alphaproteobacteria bacterium]